MSANDLPGLDPGTGSAAQVGPMDFSTQDPNGPVTQYDKDGYPLPPQGFATDLHSTFADPNYLPNQAMMNTWQAAPQRFDPNAPLPESESNNPYPLGAKHDQWIWKQKILAENQARQKTWQTEHESQRKVQAAVAPAPATPFQSSGVDLTKQGKGENYIDSILSHYEQEGAPETTNYSAAALADFNAKQPQNMDAYYDNASRKSQNAINTQMAARGSYGSSNAIGTLGAAETDLRAQQARDEAGYGLQRFGVQNTLSNAADSQNNNRSANQMLWAKGLADLATQDQGLGENRNQTLWGNNLSLAGIKAATYGNGANSAIDDVTAANDAANNARMGVATDAQSNAAGNANRTAQTNSSLLNSATQGTANMYNYYKKPGSS